MRKLGGSLLLTFLATTFATAGVIDFSVLQPRGNYAAVVDGDADAADLQLKYRTLNPDFSQYSTRVSFWNAGYSDLPSALFSDYDGAIQEITLVPVGFSTVTLNSFLLGSFFDGPARTATVFRVTDGLGNILWSSEPQNYAANPKAKLINVGVSAASLKILMGTDWNMGINNINYTSSDGQMGGVPEPTTMALVGGALAAAIFLRRRK